MRLAGKTMTMLLVMIFTVASMAMAQPMPPVKVAQEQPAPEMSYRQAQRAFMAAIQYAELGDTKHFTGFSVDQGSVRMTQGTVEFDAKGTHFTIPLKGLGKLTVKNGEVKEEGSKYSLFLKNYNPTNRRTVLYFLKDEGKNCPQAQNHGECRNSAAQFAAALNSLHVYASRPTTPDEDFQKQAAAWRALATKPALPDTVRVRRMMAEDALKNKKPGDALRYYEQGIESYAMWPEGWFNAALVAGELGEYPEAVEFMQNYLELVPDAKDAQSARDQLEIWKMKAQEKK